MTKKQLLEQKITDLERKIKELEYDINLTIAVLEVAK